RGSRREAAGAPCGRPRRPTRAARAARAMRATKENLDLTKDNLLFAVFGILVGFIAGYLMHEVMAMRQPQRQLAAAGAPTPQMPQPQDAGMPQDGSQDMGAGGAAPGTGGPPMQEVQELTRRVAANPNDSEAVLRLANLNFEIRQWDRAQQLY